MNFEDLSKEKRRELSVKLMFLLGYLENAIDIADELSCHPSIHKFNFKKTSNNFRDAAGVLLKEVLYDFKGEHFHDDEGNRITNTDDIQKEAFVIIEQIKKLNKIAIEELCAELNEA